MYRETKTSQQKQENERLTDILNSLSLKCLCSSTILENISKMVPHYHDIIACWGSLTQRSSKFYRQRRKRKFYDSARKRER